MQLNLKSIFKFQLRIIILERLRNFLDTPTSVMPKSKIVALTLSLKEEFQNLLLPVAAYLKVQVWPVFEKLFPLSQLSFDALFAFRLQIF